MSRLGQCPSCRVVYELDDNIVGQVLQCQCGAALFACDTAGFSEIPVFCTQCDGEYVVDRDGAGQVVQCECGAQITVPTVVLRLPVASPDTTAEALLSNPDPAKTVQVSSPAASSPDLSNPDHPDIIQCPACGLEYSIVAEDVGDKAVCTCGCVFVVGTDGQVVATQPLPTNESQPAAGEQTESKPQRPHRKQPVSILSIAGVAAVALLLLISIIMFVTRDSGKVALTTAAETNDAKLAVDTDSVSLPKGTTIQSNPLIASGAAQSMRPIPAAQPLVVKTSSGEVAGRHASDSEDSTRSQRQPAAFLAPPPPTPLPQVKPPREVIPVAVAANRGLTFQRAYAEAFAAYEETNRLKAETDASGDPQAYHQQLGQAIGLLQQTLDLAMRQAGNDKINELRYLLTYLYYTAGRLPEAAVLGEAVARWGNAQEKSTREAAMIALAASQEANETGWGVAAAVGELDQMRTVAEIVSTRWPQDLQLDLIWMNLGQRYEAFGKPLQAAAAFSRVPESSSQYGAAQLAAGNAMWVHYRIVAAGESEADSGDQAGVLKQAESLLSSGVDALVAEQQPTMPIMSAKLTLARIAVLSNDLQTAESRLVNEPMPVTESITTSKPTATAIQVAEPFLRAVFETLFEIRTQQGDPAGAKSALEMMTAKLGPNADPQVGKMFLKVATDYIEQLASAAVVTREQFSTLCELIEPLKEQQDTLKVSNILWLGESWSRLAEHAATPELARQCYEKAAAAYQLAMSRSDFPPASRQSAVLRRSQLLRNSGNMAEAIPLLEEILRETPNAFALQMEAAEALQQAALDSGQADGLLAALNGPVGSADEAVESPIWGWSKLVTTLHNARSGDEEKDRERLLQCQYNMYLCRLLIAQANPDADARRVSLADLQQSLSRLVTTTSPERAPWYEKFRDLLAQASAVD